MITGTKNSGSPTNLIFAVPDEIVSVALAKMNENSVTQIPVLENNQSVGSLRESQVLTKLLVNRDLLNAKVSEVMDKSFPVLEVDASFNATNQPIDYFPEREFA